MSLGRFEAACFLKFCIIDYSQVSPVPIISLNDSPFILASARLNAMFWPVHSRSSAGTKNQSTLSNLTAIQGSAPNFFEYSLSSSTSFVVRYCFISLVALHSIAILRMAFPAIMSGLG